MAARAPVYSYSRLVALDKCPRVYEYRYVLRKREAFQSVEAFMGQTVHETLAWLYAERDGARAPTESQAQERFDADWDARLSPRVRVVRDGDSLEARRDLGRAMVARHHRDRFVHDRSETVAVERRLDVRLADGSAFRGIVDRIARTPDGGVEVVDFKTTGRPPVHHGPAETLQLRAYGLAVLRHHDDVEQVRLRYEYLSDGGRFELDAGAPEVERTEEELTERIAVVEDAVETAEFPANPSVLCRWCGFREACDASEFFAGGGGASASGSATAIMPGAVAAGGDRAAAATDCPVCGSDLAVRRGRNGPFIGCTGFPDCRYTRDVRPADAWARAEIDDDGDACPRCGSELVERNGRHGAFLGCSGYPECRYTRDA
jgi:RecB family exonuclease/ribosomal protein L37AE/L43A